MKTSKKDGVQYAEGVEPAPEGEPSPEFLAEIKKKPKIRITTMIDLDIYEALKRRAAIDGDGRYQTYLNQLLHSVLMLGFGDMPNSPTGVDRSIACLRSDLAALNARVDNIDRKNGTLKKRKKHA